MSRTVLRLASWLLPLLAAAPCAAEVQVSLPLQGYYRVGRYLPVHVVARGESAGELTLSAAGAVPVTIRLAGGSCDAVVPFLVVRDPPGPLAWSLPGGQSGTLDPPWVPLAESDRLVGVSGTDSKAAAAALPGMTVIPVALQLTGPTLAGPLQAWEVMDAVVLDQAPGVDVAGSLAVAGTTVVVRSAAAPEPDGLPWRREGGAWVMGQQPAGPSGAVVPEAYDPAAGWRPGRHPAIRRQVVLAVVVFAILVVAATLWRSRLAVAAVLALSAAATGALAFRAARQSPVAVAGGAVVVRRASFTQSDDWTYFQSTAAATAYVRAGGLTKPVFASLQHFDRSAVKLVCDPKGTPITFELRLAPRATVAFLTRNRLAPPDARTPDRAARGSPLWPLARQAYVNASSRAAGEVPYEPDHAEPDMKEQWPGVVVEEFRR